MIQALLFLVTLAHAGSELEKLKGCAGQLVSLTVANVERRGTFEVTGIVHKVTPELVDFGGILVPTERIVHYVDNTVRRPVEGDLITFFTPAGSIEGARIIQRCGIFKSVKDGVVATAQSRIRGVDFVSALLIIAPGTPVRLAFTIDEDDAEIRSFETTYLGNDGHRLNFGGILYNEDAIVGLYAL